jgi:exonuclease III
VTGTDTFTGQDVALLTRIDPENDAIQRDDRQGQAGTVRKAVSKNYQAKLSVDNTKIALIGLHFLAFPLNQSRRLEREAQADAMRQVALEFRAQGFRPIVLGDFNDYDGDADSRDHRDNMPVTNVLRNLKAMDPGDPADNLVNASTFVPKAVRYTAFHDANRNGQVDFPNEVTSIDHILLAPELAERVDVVEIPHDHDPRQVSDHFPVVARLRLCDPDPTPPPGGPGVPTAPGTVRLISLLPNPPGDDSQNEEATLKNFGGQPASVIGWRLRDLSGRTWTLDALGTLQPGEQKTVRRLGQPMALNNRGDTIDLVDASGMVVQTVTYGPVQPEELVLVGN